MRTTPATAEEVPAEGRPARDASSRARLAAGLFALGLLGVAVGLVAAAVVVEVVVLLLLGNAEGTAPTLGVLAISGTVLLGPPAWWAVRGGPRARAFCAGVGLAGLAVLVVPLAPRSTGVEARLREVGTSAPVTLYYVDGAVEGHDLDDIALWDRTSDTENVGDRRFDVGELLTLEYGSSCGAFTAGTCGAVDELQERVVRRHEHIACVRTYPTTRGVTPVSDGSAARVYTGDVVVELALASSPSADTVGDVVLALRPLPGSPRTRGVDGDLPPPPPRIEDQIASCARNARH